LPEMRGRVHEDGWGEKININMEIGKEPTTVLYTPYLDMLDMTDLYPKELIRRCGNFAKVNS
jgi:hypothetical protein